MRVIVAIIVLLAVENRWSDDCDQVPVWRDGNVATAVCRADAAAAGLTLIDLGDDWVPRVLAQQVDGKGPSYRDTYLALAQERFDNAGLDGELARSDRYLELYGIEPSFDVVRQRLAEETRHRCHAGVADSQLANVPERITEEQRADGLARIATAKRLRDQLDKDPQNKRISERLRGLEARIAAVRAVQDHLACDDLFDSPPVRGAYTWQTSNAVERFQRNAMILPTGALDEQTRAALTSSSRERDFMTALRVLRARVIDAAALVEDGTAGAGETKVLGRMLEPEGTWRVRGYDPLDGAAPDLVDAATETAARALGWKDPASTLDFLVALEARPSRSKLVAIALPPPPPYHAAKMQLEVEIDRGDVSQDREPSRDAERRPALILYARDGETRIPLARWPTTIGGWQDEKNGDDDIVKEWKESPVGPRIWRDLYVGPSWLAPETTPDRELVRRTDHGYVLAREQFGPSYRAAFGFVAFVHFRQDGELYRDEGIRTHGTGNLSSLVHGVSHGCHRLVGMHVVRLADFVLAHHDHAARGDEPTSYHRVVSHGGEFPIDIETLGYRIELTPPIPVEVLPGRVHP